MLCQQNCQKWLFIKSLLCPFLLFTLFTSCCIYCCNVVVVSAVNVVPVGLSEEAMYKVIYAPFICQHWYLVAVFRECILYTKQLLLLTLAVTACYSAHMADNIYMHMYRLCGFDGFVLTYLYLICQSSRSAYSQVF